MTKLGELIQIIQKINSTLISGEAGYFCQAIWICFNILLTIIFLFGFGMLTEYLIKII
jgi:hypothetical protein